MLGKGDWDEVEEVEGILAIPHDDIEAEEAPEQDETSEGCLDDEAKKLLELAFATTHHETA